MNVAVAANELQIDFSNAFVVVGIAKYKDFIKKSISRNLKVLFCCHQLKVPQSIFIYKNTCFMGDTMWMWKQFTTGESNLMGCR